MEPSSRRFYLAFVLKILMLVGLVALAVPFVASLGTDDENPQAQPDPWRIEVDWSTIAPGSYQVVEWPLGQQVWIYRRDQYDLGTLPNLDANELRDPDSQFSRQPAGLNTPWRSRSPAVFVFLPYETTRHCQVHFDSDQNQFVEPCHGGRFDTAGRGLRGTGVAQQHNLTVPNYELTGDNSLRLLPPGN